MATGVIGFTAQGAIGQQLAAWDLLPKVQTETELYFSEPSKLPTTYTPAEPTPITTTAHNTSNDTKRYTYQIIQTNDDSGVQPTSLYEEQLTLLPGETKQIRHSVKPVDTGKRANFSVQLKDSSQQINFWTTKK